MFVKLLIPLALALIVTQVLCEGVTSPQQQQTQQHASQLSNARKIRLLAMNPGAIRLYRLMASGAISDDQDNLPDDESYFQKRQYDDYGHMRFGKRNPKDFDDYGHMRFGKK